MVRLVYTARIPDSYIEIWNSEYVGIYNENIYTAAEDKPIVHVFESFCYLRAKLIKNAI